MGLFLLTIPIALAGGAILKEDVEYTTLGLKIPTASFDLDSQIRQIEEHLFEIFEYVGVEGDINVKGRTIVNTEYNGYNALDRFLAEKGYRKEAIDYAINRYNQIAEKELQDKTIERDKRIRDYEWRLKHNETYYDTWENNVAYYHTQEQVEHKVEQLLQYFKTHGQKDIYCNIIMGGKALYHNHTEVWHMKIPCNTHRKEIEQYFKDVYNKIIGDD